MEGEPVSYQMLLLCDCRDEVPPESWCNSVSVLRNGSDSELGRCSLAGDVHVNVCSTCVIMEPSLCICRKRGLQGLAEMLPEVLQNNDSFSVRWADSYDSFHRFTRKGPNQHVQGITFK